MAPTRSANPPDFRPACDLLGCRKTGGSACAGVGALVLLLVATLATPAAAEFPDKPIRLIVPQAAGSATDTVARILGAELGKELGQQIVVDNRPGGALTIGLDLTAKAEPDGYTICMGPIGALAITRHMVAKLPYDIERDFQPIALVARGHLLLAAAPDAPFKTVRGADRLREEESRQAVERLIEQRLARPCRRRAVQVHERHRDRAHPVSRRRGGDQRPDRRARAADVREPELDRAACALRHGAGARGQRRAALARLPRPADGRGGRRAGLCGADLERRDRPGRHPAADRRQAQRGDQPRDQVAGLQGALRRDRRRAGRRQAGGLRRR